MHRIIATLVLFSLFLAGYTQSTLHITGVYLDKKSNPLDGAAIEYLMGGSSSIGTTTSGEDGTFDLLVDLTGVDDFRQVFSVAAHPNPFGSGTSFTVHVPAEGKVIITDIKGTFVNSVDLKEGGVYEVTWGGKDKIGRQVSEGAYVIRVSGKGYSASQKVVYQPSGSSDRLRANKLKDAALKSTNDNDIIRFTRDNTTLLELPVNLPSGDTTLGVVQGNHGPQNLEDLSVTVHIDSLENWNLNSYFYNDDQSVYEVSEPGFEVIEDSLLSYTGGEAGEFAFDVDATDGFDPLLSSIMNAQVNITNTSYFNLSGTYLDQQDGPIDEALVEYLQSGSTPLNQATTASDGSFSLDMAVDPDGNKSSDVLRFTKENTSDTEVSFSTPLQDTVIGVTGNLGPVALDDIDATLFTNNPYFEWNLNNYFSNDDQSAFSVSSDQFSIVNDTSLVFDEPEQGNYATTVTATDTADNTLQATLSAQVEVQYTLLLPDYDLVEDTPQDTLIENIDAFKNPLYPGNLSYTIVSQSDPSLIGLSIENNAVLIDSLQADGFGISTIGIQACDGAYCDTVWFDVTVMPRPDVFGTIMDLFDSTLLVSFAVVYIEEDGFMHIDTCDVMGHYHIQLNEEVDSVSFYPVTIYHEDYTTFHTWATVEPESKLSYTYEKTGTGYKGIVKNTMTGETVDGATITFHDPEGDVSDVTNADGEYSVEIITEDYIEVTIEHDDYTTFHTWYDNNAGSGVMDYRLVYEDYKWDFYHKTFTSGECTPENEFYDITCRWIEPATIHIYNDSSLVNIDIEEHYNNSIVNIETILPTFNPVEGLYDDVVLHPEGIGYIIQEGEFGIGWNNNIPGSGTWSCVQDGPVKIKCTATFRDSVGIGTAINRVFNQELGSAMGATDEPQLSPDYSSVFTPGGTGAGGPMFTEDDYAGADIYLNRSLLHFYNLDYTWPDPQGFDWEMHPEIVEEYFGSEDKKSKKNWKLVINTDKETITYDYDKIPSSVMKQNKIMFSAKEIKQQEKKERKAKRLARRKGLVYEPPQPVSVTHKPAKRVDIAQHDSFGQLLNTWSYNRNIVRQKQAMDYLSAPQLSHPNYGIQKVMVTDRFSSLVKHK